MPFTNQLTDDEVVLLMEVTGVSDTAEMTWRLDTIADQNFASAKFSKMSADLAAYAAIQLDTLKISGGRDGIDLDEARTRLEIARNLKIHLRMESVSNGVTRLVRA